MTNLLAASRISSRSVDPEAVRRYLSGDPDAERFLSELLLEMEEE